MNESGFAKNKQLKQPSLNTSTLSKLTRTDGAAANKQSVISQQSSSVLQPSGVQLSLSARSDTNHLRSTAGLKAQASKQQSFGLYPYNNNKKQTV